MRTRRRFVASILAMLALIVLSVWQVGLTSAANPPIDVEKYVSTDGRNWQDADRPTGLQVLAGEDIWFEIVVTNGGDATLTNITLEDSDFELNDCEVSDELAPDASFTCTLGPLAAEEGQHTNTATASGMSGKVSYHDTDEAHYVGTLPAPSIDVEKYISTNGQNWQDADAPTGPKVLVGADVWFKFVVTNDGNIPLTDVALEDSNYAVSECALPGEAAPGESFECIIGPFAAEQGQHRDIATANSNYADGSRRDQDEAHYFGATPSINVEKVVSIDGQTWEDADAPTGPSVLAGKDIWFKFVVANAGNVTLANVSLGDSDLDLSGCGTPDELAPGGSFECVIGPLPAKAGQHTDTATASGDYAEQSYTAEDDANYRGLAFPCLDVEKYVSTDRQSWQDADTPAGLMVPVGEEVWFRFVVTNNGNVPLTNVTLTDNYFDLSDCGTPTELVPGEPFVCTMGGFPAEAGQHTNTAAARATYSGQTYTDSDAAYYFGAAPSIDIEKYVSADGESWADADAPLGLEVLLGGDVWFKFVVTNAGNVSLTGVTVSDSDFDLSGCALTDPLAAGTSLECVIGPLPAIQGQHSDTASASGTYAGKPYTDVDDANYFGAAPSIDVEKYISADGQMWVDADAPTGPQVVAGANVWFKFVVTNDGNIALTNIALTDTDFNLSGCRLTQPLAAGATFQCIIGPFAAQVGQHTDTATAGGKYAGKGYTDNDAANYFGTTPDQWDHSSLYFDEDGGCQGDCEEIRAQVCNAGEDMAGPSTWELYWIASGDAKNGTPIASGIIHTLPAGDCQVLIYTPADNSNGGSGNYMFKAYQRPDYPGTGELWGQPCELVCALLPSIDVEKTPDLTSVAESGAVVTFTVQVSNTGGEAVTLDSLVDNVFGDLNGQGTCRVPQAIPVEGSYTCSFIRFVSGDYPGSHVNIVTATAGDDAGNSDTASDDATVTFDDMLPDISVIKSANPTAVPETGGDVHFIVNILNHSSEAVTLDSLVDNVFGDLNGQGTCLVPQTMPGGGSYTCSFAKFVSGDYPRSHVNVVTARASDDEGNSHTASDNAMVTFDDVLPDISVIKSADPSSVPETGGNATFSVMLINHSQEAVTLNTLSDDKFGDLDGQGTCAMPQTIPGGGNYACSFAKPLSGTGSHVNTVTARASDDDGTTVTASDNETVAFNPPLPPCIKLTKTIYGPYRTSDKLFLSDGIIPVAVQSSNNLNPYGGENFFHFLVEIRLENCGGTELTGVVVQDSFSDKAQPFETDDPGSAAITPAPDPNHGFVKESLTWSVGTLMIGQTRTLNIKVGTESNPDGLLEPTDAPQSIFFNGQDDDTVSARLTADGGLSASVGAMQISTGGLMGCNPSMGQWHNLVFKAGSNTDPHDECVQITTLLPISLTASDSGTASVIAGASTLEAEGAARTTQNEAATGLGGFLAGVVQALQKLLADLVAFVQNLF